jgi:Transglycosylase SLT domain
MMKSMSKGPKMPKSAAAAALFATLSAVACAPVAPVETAPTALPVMAWDHVPDGPEWTQATLDALRAEGAPLLSLVPGDIDSWCPGYPAAGPEQRAAFWAGLLSALARHESTWREDAVGGGGQWFGLVQISPATARGYGCEARSGDALTQGEQNLSCAVRIAATTVTRDGVISAGGGFAADWGPFNQGSKREQMRDWVSQQAYCQPPVAATIDPFDALFGLQPPLAAAAARPS